MANIDLQTGTFPITQIPLDAKAFAITAAELATLGANDLKAYYYYEGLIIWCVENQLRYQWREEASLGETGGLLATSYTYPVNAIANGVDYSGRIFNLFLYQIGAGEVYNFQEFVSNNIDVTRNSFYVNIRLDEDTMLDGDAVLVDEPTLEFWVRADSYIINSTPYTATAAQIFLAALPGVGNRRIDVFYADINGLVGVVTGPEAGIAVAPVLDPDTQIEITFVELDENGLVGITEELVYDENVGTPTEYAVTESTAGVRINLASNVDPANNTVSIEATNPIDGDIITFTPLLPVSVIGISSLYMRIKNKVAGELFIRVSFWNGTTVVGGRRLRLRPGNGYDRDNITDHQIVNIPASQMRFTGDEFTHFTFRISALGALTTTAGFFLDHLRMISGADGTGGFGDGTWIGLRDTFERDYVNKAKYSPIVQDNERGLSLRREILFEDIVGPNAGIRTGVSHITGRTYRVWGEVYRIDNNTYDALVEGEVTLDEPDATFDRYDLFVIINGTGSVGTLTLVSGTSPVDSVLADGVTITSASVAFDTDLDTTAIRVAENINSNVSEPNYWAKAVGSVISITAYNPGNGSDGFVIGVVTANATSSVPLAGGSDVHSVGFIKGDAIADPAEPNIDYASQVKVGFKRVTANETLDPPEITTYNVYNEDDVPPNEWTNIELTGGASVTYPTNPYDQSVSVHIPATITGAGVAWQNDVNIPYDANGYILFAIKITSPLIGGPQGGPSATASILQMTIRNLAQTRSSTFFAHHAVLELYGFDNQSTDWQYLQIPMDHWNFGTGGTGVNEFDTFGIKFVRTPELQLDLIDFQVGVNDGGNSGPVPEYRLSPVVGNKFSLTRDGIPVPEEITLVSSTGFEALNEGSGIGWRLIGRDPLDYGPIGLNSIDASFSSAPGNVMGALGDYTIVVGLENKGAGDYDIIVGDLNTSESGTGGSGIFGSSHIQRVSAGFTFNNIIAGYLNDVSSYGNAVFGIEQVLVGANNDAGYNLVSGRNNNAESYTSQWLGAGLLGEGSYVTVIGVSNIDFTEDSQGSSAIQRRLFVIGNGTIDGSGNRVTPNDAVRVWRNGEIDNYSITNIKIDAWATDTILVSRGYTDANYLRANLQTEFSTSIVAIAGHANHLLIFESAIARNYTINNPLVNGDVIEFANVGTANLNFVAGTGTLNAPQGVVLEPDRICSLVKRTSDGEYWLFGELT